MTELRYAPARRVRRTAGAFEEIYRAQVGVVTAYFARRTGDPQTTADLTADTFVAAITSFGTFDPAKGTARAWLFGIARRVFAGHCEAVTRGRDVVVRLGGRRVLGPDELAELDARIDAERAGRALIDLLQTLPQIDREAIELVDLTGLTPSEAAKVLEVSPGALRIRLFRARGKLRKLVGAGDE
ncbi:RNA polymerase sigma factor [Amycolatopsis jejuensis]|uniref:RNA polymerase sigma factor n=1 Tax=Amycolatopsis jejuensis TaxID=330084 RepID=UPI000690BA62|nr:RNA polymerase sigma factor [Amycolatopsis jejuensis]